MAPRRHQAAVTLLIVAAIASHAAPWGWAVAAATGNSASGTSTAITTTVNITAYVTAPYGAYFNRNGSTVPPPLVLVAAGTPTPMTTAPGDTVPRAVAVIGVVGSYNASGWDMVNVTALPGGDASAAATSSTGTAMQPLTAETAVEDAVRYYAMGYLEGYTTQKSIYYSYQPAVQRSLSRLTPQHNRSFFDYVERHFQYLFGCPSAAVGRAGAEVNASSGWKFNPSDATVGPFYRQVGLFMRQLQGLFDGYVRRWVEQGSPEAERFPSILNMFLLNLVPELGDLLFITTPPTESSYAATESSTADDDGAYSLASLKHALSVQAFVPDVAMMQRRPDRMMLNSHCSVLIKPTSTDLIAAHTTWTSFTLMFRQYKTYTFIRHAAVGSAAATPSPAGAGGGRGITDGRINQGLYSDRITVTLSSYPGTLSSIDDWYITSNYLTVTETTIAVFNQTLYRLYVQPETVSEYLRVMTANVVAQSGRDWVGNFSIENSGTYCNEWMVVDMKQFNPNGTSLFFPSPGTTTTTTTPSPSTMDDPTLWAAVGNGTLWVADQLPGSVVSADVSYVLREKGYFASYNVPFFPSVFNATLNGQQASLFGSLPSYEHYVRAEMFRALQDRVTSVDGMKFVIRYNNYTLDPLARIPNCTGAGGAVEGQLPNVCSPLSSPWLSIASRGDQAPCYGNRSMKHYGIFYNSYRCEAFGAIDAKISTFSAYVGGALHGTVQSGPTTSNGQIPPFDWQENGGVYLGAHPEGMPLGPWDHSWLELTTLSSLPPLSPRPLPVPMTTTTPGPSLDITKTSYGMLITLAVIAVLIIAFITFMVDKCTTVKHEPNKYSRI